jgi:hypothetical protein
MRRAEPWRRRWRRFPDRLGGRGGYSRLTSDQPRLPPARRRRRHVAAGEVERASEVALLPSARVGRDSSADGQIPLRIGGAARDQSQRTASSQRGPSSACAPLDGGQLQLSKGRGGRPCGGMLPGGGEPSTRTQARAVGAAARHLDCACQVAHGDGARHADPMRRLAGMEGQEVQHRGSQRPVRSVAGMRTGSSQRVSERLPFLAPGVRQDERRSRDRAGRQPPATGRAWRSARMGRRRR